MIPPRNRQAIAFLIGSILMLPILFGRDWVAGNDSYYHLAMARHPVALGMADAFPWLQWTIFRDVFINHHLGFQFLLFPLVRLSDALTGDLIRGGQAALLLCAGATSLCLYRLLARRGVPNAVWWCLLLGALPWHFWLRQGYVRAPIVALPMMLLALELFARRIPLKLAALACAFMLVYFGAVVFGLLCGCMLAGWWLGREPWRNLVRPAIAVAAGLAAGFVLHPSFPENIGFMKIQLFDSGLSAAADIGNEWKPPEAWFAATMWMPLAAVWLAAIAWRVRRGTPIDGYSIGLLLVTVAFLLLTARMRRFVEYAPVFMLASAADLARLDLGAAWNRLRHPAARIIAAACFIALCATGPAQARMNVRAPFSRAALEPAMTWLKENSPVDSLVLTDDWDIFPACFYLNRHNRYAVGLDPMFTARRYPAHWNRYKIITRGKASDEGMKDIHRLFRAHYVLVQWDHPRLYRKLTDAPDLFTRVFPVEAGEHQPPAAVFLVRDASRPEDSR